MARQKLPFMLERIRRCRGCGTEVDKRPLEYEANPYCSNCLSKEIKKGVEADVIIERVGHYLKITRKSPNESHKSHKPAQEAKSGK